MNLRALLRRKRVESEMHAELAFHLEQETEANLGAGMSPADARHAALRSAGSLALVKDQCRESLGLRLVDDLRQDVRHGARALAKHPGFTITAVLTLALGIGANSAIFTLLDGIMFKPLGVPAAAELVALYENGPEGAADASGGTGRFLRFSYPRFTALGAALGAHGSLAAVTRSTPLVYSFPGASEKHKLAGQLASGNYFTTLRVAASRGRLLTSDDERAAAPVAVVSDTFWRRALGGADSAIGQTIVLNGVTVEVVGVAEPDFVGMWSDAEADVWVPLTLQHALRYQNNSSSYGDRVDLSQPWMSDVRVAWLNLVGRVPARDLVAGTAMLQAANREGVVALAAMLDPRDSMKTHTLAVEPFARGFSGLRTRYEAALAALAGMVAIVLVVTCVNIANLLLIRGVSRSRDLGIRVALGASTGRLVRQAMTESAMLATGGGAIGFLTGRWLSRTLAMTALGATNRLPAVFEPDARVLIFTAGVSLATAAVFGVAPALQAARGGRRATRASGDRSAIARSPIRAMGPLVVAQLALAMVVVFGATLLGRTLVNFARVDPGFDVAHHISASFDLAPGGLEPGSDGRYAERVSAVGARLLASAEAVPGVAGAVLARCGLVAGCSSSAGFSFDTGGTGTLSQNWVGPRYFTTVGISLIEGREFDDRDADRRPRVAIISESVARRFFPGASAIGRRVGSREIVGVVNDARSMTVHDPPVPMVYFPFDVASFAQQPVLRMEIRTAGDARSVLPLARDALRLGDPALLAGDVVPMSERIARDLARERLVAYLAIGFAGLALFLASLGLYGVLSYGVAYRTKEIGVRMALGADRVRVVLLVVRQSAGLAAVGLVLGVVGSVLAARYVQGLLFGVPPFSPSAFFAAAAVFTLVAAISSYLPARRAARVDPLVALRAD